MKKKCELCRKEFELLKTNLKKKFCSNECVQKNKSIFQKEYKNSKIGRKKNSEAQKIAQNKLEVKEKKRKSAKKYANKPEVKEKFQKWSKEYHNREESKKATSEWTKNFQKNNPDFMEYFHQRTKEYYKNEYYLNEEAQKNRSKAAEKLWKNPEYRKKISTILSEKWENPDFVNYMFSRRYSYKKFTFPSGKIVKIQGYEDKALKDLLEKYKENDIFVGAEEIREKIGKFYYYNKSNKHRYFPDIYINSINTVYEVKSKYTYNKKLNINLLKRDACLNKNINFEFLIY